MTVRDRLLDTARRLTLATGEVPSLNAVAADAGVSKGGLTHHFPTRAALVEGLADLALRDVDEAMEAAAQRGDAAATWLRISVPEGDDIRLFRALIAALPSLDSLGGEFKQATMVAIERWESMIAAELGDADRARAVRLVGDGLAANVIADPETVPNPAELAGLMRALGIAEAGDR